MLGEKKPVTNTVVPKKRANDHRQELNWGAAGGEGAAAEDPKPGDC